MKGAGSQGGRGESEGDARDGASDRTAQHQRDIRDREQEAPIVGELAQAGDPGSRLRCELG